MKSLLNKVLAVVFLVTSTLTYAQPKEDINILWAFDIGSNQANTLRLIINELNTSQNKYNFTLVHKPGAGGTIAAQTVQANPQNTVVGMSSSFITRPIFEKDGVVHNLDQFVPILMQGIKVPIFLMSKKFSSTEQLLNTKNVSLGIIGNGGIAHILADKISTINKTVTIVNYPTCQTAAVQAAGRHVDAIICWQIEAANLIEANAINILGYTGSQEVLGLKDLFLAKQKVPDANSLTASYAIYASTSMDSTKQKELHSLLASVNERPKVLAGYAKDLMTVKYMTLDQSKEWYARERTFWKNHISNLGSSK
jgi:tripartite-type tricarboxylate transporter receptor subunit TctC